jgi:hypothetical protein
MNKIDVKRSTVTCRTCNTENDPGALACSKCGLSLAASEPQSHNGMLICPRCQNTNNADSFFCYTCGKYFVDASEVKLRSKPDKRGKGVAQASRAVMSMPGGSEMILAGAPTFIERSDFDSSLPHDVLMTVSRQHVLITYSKGKYYLKDYGREGKGSTNHTKLNGVDIYGKRKKALKDGDKIELAGQPELTMTFKFSPEIK